MISMKRCFAAALLVASCAGCTGALAQMPENITDVEVSVLPGYCRDTWGFGKVPWTPDPKWMEIMGQGFMAMHHYCWALIKLNRVSKAGIGAGLSL